MRTFALAEEATQRGIECVLVGSLDGMHWVTSAFDEINCKINQVKDFGNSRPEDVLILDSYQIPPDDHFITGHDWEFIVSISDEMTPRYPANLVFHPGLNSDWFQGDLESFRFGPKYIPIRKSLREKNTLNSGRGLRIVVFGGGSDFFGFAETLAFELNFFHDVDKVVFFSNRNDLIERINPRYEVLPFGPGLDRQLRLADLVFATASTSSLELIAREVPVAIACSVDNQVENYKALANAGVAAGIGERISTGQWNLDSNHIKRIVEDFTYRDQIKQAAREYIDLQGAKRIVDEIQKRNGLANPKLQHRLA
jgi:spore coat polysaccharide biosynthesis predicted glycosyltransferase SpsG